MRMYSRVGAGGLALALLVSGCGLLGGPPKGFTETSTGSVTFIQPANWKPVPSGSGKKAPEFKAQRLRGGKPVATVSVLGDMGKARNASLAVAMAMAGPQVSWPGYQVRGRNPIELDGAPDARQVNYSYRATVPRPGGKKARVQAQGVDVAFVDGERNAHVVRITWLEGAVNDQVVKQMVSSIEVHGSE